MCMFSFVLPIQLDIYTIKVVNKKINKKVFKYKCT